MILNSIQTASVMESYVMAGLVPFIHGSPGIGKSAVVKAFAKKYKLKLIDIRLSQCDPTDLSGFPYLSGQRGTYLPMDMFPLAGDQIPNGYNGWLIFLDEANSAAEAVQAAAYKLILDRMVGNHSLHKNVAIVAAGNLETDGAVVYEMSSALKSRMTHIHMVADLDGFLHWAMPAGIHHHITDYLKFKPSAVYTFNPNSADRTYGCPRTWEYLNRIYTPTAYKDDDLFVAKATGCISEGLAREFLSFVPVYGTLPKMDEVLNSPSTAMVSSEASVLFAMTGTLSSMANEKNIKPIVEYLKRIPKEFQVLTLRELISRDRKMVNNEHIAEWRQTADLH